MSKKKTTKTSEVACHNCTADNHAEYTFCHHCHHPPKAKRSKKKPSKEA